MSGWKDDVPCERAADLAAWLFGELAPAHGAKLEDHLETCFPCREELRALDVTLLSLTVGGPPRERPAPIGPRVLAALPDAGWRPGPVPALLGVLTAAVLLVAIGVSGETPGIDGQNGVRAAPMQSDVGDAAAAKAAAIAWLVAQQGESGAFTREGRSGAPSVRSTAIVLAAISRGDLTRKGVRRALDLGVAWLLRRQDEAGRFVGHRHDGEAHRDATDALIAIQRRLRWVGLDEPLRAALGKSSGDVPSARHAAAAERSGGHARNLLRAQRRGGPFHGSFAPGTPDLKGRSRLEATACAVHRLDATP